VVELKKNYARARLLEVTTPSRARREPPCSLFGACGGCRLQHVDYREQIRLKTGLVRDSLSRIAGLESVPVLDTAGMDNPWHYRNKAQFQVEAGPGGLALGFYREGSHSLASSCGAGIGTGRGCLLVDRDLNDAASVVETLLNRHGPPGFQGEKHSRFFKRVVMRKAFATGQIMAILVTGPGDWPAENRFARELLSRQPQITSLVRSIIPGPPGPAPDGEYRLLAGREYITDRMEHLSFIISPSSSYDIFSSP
jgi:23S rRNA (uracil1939-C5)-methyltransferase